MITTLSHHFACTSKTQVERGLTRSKDQNSRLMTVIKAVLKRGEDKGRESQSVA